MSHPLMELRFELDGVQVTRFWYHVPRIGEAVSFDELKGYVLMVTWSDDWVTLTLRRPRVA